MASIKHDDKGDFPPDARLPSAAASFQGRLSGLDPVERPDDLKTLNDIFAGRSTDFTTRVPEVVTLKEVLSSSIVGGSQYNTVFALGDMEVIYVPKSFIKGQDISGTQLDATGRIEMMRTARADFGDAPILFGGPYRTQIINLPNRDKAVVPVSFNLRGIGGYFELASLVKSRSTLPPIVNEAIVTCHESRRLLRRKLTLQGQETEITKAETAIHDIGSFLKSYSRLLLDDSLITDPALLKRMVKSMTTLMEAGKQRGILDADWADPHNWGFIGSQTEHEKGLIPVVFDMEELSVTQWDTTRLH